MGRELVERKKGGGLDLERQILNITITFNVANVRIFRHYYDQSSTLPIRMLSVLFTHFVKTDIWTLLVRRSTSRPFIIWHFKTE